jgi:CRISPR-associated protein Cmr1
MEQIDIDIRTLTPIHTGNIDPTESSIRTTGLMGGLRWWYGLIYRTLGHKICDDPKKDDKIENLCRRCFIFGNTIQRRKFDLVLIEDRTEVTCSGGIHMEKRGGGRGWHLPPGRMGDFKIKIQGDAQAVNEMICLILFLERFGTLGAKPQLGFGRFQILRSERLHRRVESFEIPLGSKSPKEPNLKGSTFYSITFSDSPFTKELIDAMKETRLFPKIKSELQSRQIAPISPLVKEHFRFNLPSGYSRSPILGQNKQRARIASSWAYRDGSSWRIDVFAGPILSKDKDVKWKRYNRFLSDKEKWEEILGFQNTSTLSISSTHIDSPLRMKSLLEEVLQ